MTQSVKKQRILTMTKVAAAIGAAGLCYTAIHKATGFFIPCLFHQATGLLCPGCGVSRMCLHLLRLDFSGAFGANPVLFMMLPLLALILIRSMIQYYRAGTTTLSRRWEVLAIALLVILLLFGVWRNLLQYAILHP